MSVSAGIAKMQKSLKELKTRWEEMRPIWRDQAAVDFEAEFVEPLEQKLLTTLNMAQRLQLALNEAKRDCSP